MKKRDVFSEIMQGFEELEAERAGKLTLRNIEVEALPPVEIKPQEIIDIRTRLKMSQPVFAARLRVSPRSLQGWEQGKSQPGGAVARTVVPAYPIVV